VVILWHPDMIPSMRSVRPATARYPILGNQDAC
jgi:hypothetical protein